MITDKIEIIVHFPIVTSMQGDLETGAVHKRRHHSRGEGGLPKDDLT